MLVLFETAAGYAVFKWLGNEKKLKATENLYKDFETPEKAAKVLKLKHFEKFEDMTEALAATTAAVEGKVAKKLKKMLKKFFVKEAHEELAVADAVLGKAIKDKLNISCVANSSILELMRQIRGQADSLLSGFPQKEMTAMALGLAHSLSRYKLKFSPDKIDTMIIQAVSLLDDLDKELNNYVMRCREWYGWHFPELGKIVTDNLVYVKTIKILGIRENASSTDLSEVLPEDVEALVKEAAEISMGTEVADDDILKIGFLCDQIIEMTNYRTQLYEYLKNRMVAIAPNLTILIGELVGARLIAHAGSLMNLAKHPASTVQILGAEKALFRALKTKHDTPKYGLIYHALLVGQAATKNKGTVSRMVAAKSALCVRVDALGEEVSGEFGIQAKANLVSRIKMLEEGATRQISGKARAQAKMVKYESKSEFRQYPDAADVTNVGQGRKRKFGEDAPETPVVAKKKFKKEGGDGTPAGKKKFQKEDDNNGEYSGFQASSSPPKKKKKVKHEPVEEPEPEVVPEVSSEKKKKKKKKKVKEEQSE